MVLSHYYLRPWDLGVNHLLKFDHDFVGRDALQAMVDQPRRRKAILVWNRDDLATIQGSLFQPGIPSSIYKNMPFDAVADFAPVAKLAEAGYAFVVNPGVQAKDMKSMMELFLAVTGSARNPIAPEIPTFKEQGIDIMDGIDAWYAVIAPGKTPPDVVARINRDFIEVMNMEDVKAALAKQGLSVRTNTPEQMTALVKSDMAHWKKVVTDGKITAD